MQEMELEPRVKPLTYKVKGISRESPSQKASHVLDIDLRNHWSTATNTKEWILLELDEPCLLSQIRIYNKSVLEWEISVGLRYKPETFIKVRPRCEAPRRDMIYPMNYTACRYVRISCLRGNPIAIFFIQLIGVPVTGLEPEFQPVINHLLPQIISHKQDTEDIHLQLLQDLTNRLVTFLPQLEADLNSFPEAPESSLRFLAMLAGPFYPILHVLIERETAKSAGTTLDTEASKNSLPSPALTVSSNFEPRRTRPTIPTFSNTSTVFRPDAILLLLRKAYKDTHLGTVCRMASRVLLKLNNQSDATSAATQNTDYSDLFGEEFRVTDDNWDFKYLQLLDIKAVEEGILHVLFACASQPLLCSKLAGNSSEFWSTLPLIQALLPALSPNFNSSGQAVDDSFSAWRQPFVQHALSQIVVTSTSPMYRPLLHGCSGYLSSFSPSHAKAACVLIDLCTGVLGPWLGQVIAKVDLAVELVENLLGVIHGARNAISDSRAALKYIILALSGHMDNVLPKYKQVKHQILFLLQILEPFLDPALTPIKTTIPFGDLSPLFHDTHHHNCHVALNLIRTAVSKSDILPSLESQWRRNSVPPIVLLSILEPHIQLPPNTDLAKSITVNPQSPDNSPQEDENSDTFDDVSVLFAPIEFNNIVLTNTFDPNTEEKILVKKLSVKREENLNAIEYSKLQTECLHLMSYSDCELWASEFKRVAFDLHSQSDVTSESHNAAIDALLLAAECYVNPFFMMSFKDNITNIHNHFNFTEIRKILEKSESNLETIEKKRDKIVLEVLLKAAKLDQKYQNVGPQNEDDDVMKFSVTDTSNMDAITLVRQNQDLLFKFLVNSLTKEVKEQHSMREILLQSLVFLLQSATKLYCPPGQIIDIILKSSEYLNEILVSYCHKGKLELELVKVHEIERYWMLIQKLVVASSGDSEGHFSNLVPPSSWVNKISSFSSSSFPLVRFIGWMAVSRNCKQFKKERLVLTSELTQLTTLLTIFTDELAVIDDVSGQHVDRSFGVTYPEISQFFPNLKKQFKQFGENILEAVGLQVRSFPSSVVPDLLCWFSELCSHDDVIISSRRFLAKNTKAVVLYVLESIVTEHMEAMVPEIPRVVQVLQSLCKTSYADVAFLDSVLKLLNPIISYSLKKASKEEGGTCFEFESLCFDEIFSNIKNEITSGEEYSKAPSIFVLASVFLDLSLKRKLEILKSLIFWADFATFEPTNSFHDYLSAFQTVLETSRSFLVERLQVTGVIPLEKNEKNESDLGFLKDAYQVFDEMPSDISNHFSVEETMEFCKVLEALLSKLNPTIELCWKLHFQLAKKLTATSAECFVYSKSLSLLVSQNSTSPWIKSLEQLSETLLVLQENSLWEVSSEILNCILDIKLENLDNLITPIFPLMKTFSSKAPKVTWRLQTDKWLSKLLNCGTHIEPPLTDLLSSLMSHIEPEQRFIALKHLGNLVDKVEMTILPSLVSNTWDKIVVMAKSDVSYVLRTRAMAVLVKCVPFAEREKLQCVLNVVDGFLPCLVNLGQRTCEGPFVQLCLVLIGNICLYCPTEDVGLIPESVWRNIESLGVLENGKCDDVVRSVCEALCKLKSEGDEAKEILKGVLTSDFSKEGDPDFGSTRETLLQVLANLTSVQSYFDFFSEKTDEKLLEIEEAEIEMDLIQKEQSVQESSSDSTDWRKLPFLANYEREDKRLEEIKDHIQSLEKAKLKEEIIARRQKKLLIRRARQKYLEETALHEAELLQELDRERAVETEKEIERQKLLAIERAKTRELQHSLEMEKEKKTQRELQRELEQAEARPPSRREYSSGPSSRPRERYRERDNNGRSPNEGNLRPSGPSGDFTNSTILSGARQFSGQPPTLLQPRDRQDDSSYEENFDGSRDSGDTGSVGEPDIMMALEGQSDNFGSGQRNVSRGNKSRQMVERRERDGRREGKWERRH